MKKIISVILCLVMFISLVPAAVLADAPKTKVTKIELTVEPPVAGKAVGESLMVPKITTEPENAAELIEDNLCWYCPDGSYFNGIFQEGETYSYDICIIPKDGYEFEMDGDEYKGTILGNGTAPGYTESFKDGIECSVNVTCKPGTAKTAVTEVVVTGSPVPVAGKTAAECSVLPKVATVPADAAEETAVEVSWYSLPSGERFTGTFKPGTLYLCEICVKLKEGYKIPFDKNWNFTGTTLINGEKNNAYSETNLDGGALYFAHTFKTEGEAPEIPVTKIDITVNGPLAGMTADATPTIVTEPAGAVTVVESGSYVPEWKDSDFKTFTGTFVKYDKYYYSVGLVANDGYRFDFNDANQYTGKVTINGAPANTARYIFGMENSICVQGLFSDPVMTVDGNDYSAEDLQADIDCGTWNWNADKQEITLNGYNGGSIFTCRALTLNLAEGTDNTVTVPAGADRHGICSGNNMLITGKGNLTIKNNNTEYSAIYTGGGNDCTVNMEGSLNISSEGYGISTYNYAQIAGSGDVIIASDRSALYIDETLTLSGSGNVILTSREHAIDCCGEVIISGSGSISAEATGKEMHAVYLNNTGDRLYLNGTAAPITLKNPDGLKAVYNNSESGKSIVEGGNLAYYNKITGSPEESLVIYDHNTNPFKDIPETSWYTEPCLWCNAKGYITGTGDDTFNPSGTLTRAQFVQILAKVDGVDLNAVKYSGRFTDVKDGVWYAKAVQWAVDCGVTGGTGDKTFSPNNAVSREQLATFFMAYAGYKGYDVSATASLAKYTDAGTIAAWAKSAVTWAIAEGLISGTTDTTISPKKSATRAQAAVIFRSFVENYVSKQPK